MQIYKLSFILGLLVGGSVLSACSTQQPIYHWGHYEPLIYDMYHKPGKADPTTQILKLTEDIQWAKSRGKKVPPGVHAHLGMMYAAEGNYDLAQAAFLEEKTLFPESAVLIDGMMARALNGIKADKP